MAPPTNISAGTAVEILTLPYHTTQNVNDGGTTYTVWYKYTIKKYQYNLSVFPLGDVTGAAGTYRPTCDMYVNDPVNGYRDSVNNSPAQVSVHENEVWYFKIRSNTGNVAIANLTFDIITGPNEALPIGSVLVNDDTEGYPAAILNISTGKVIGFRDDFVAGESGDVLKNGDFILADEYNNKIVLYDSQLNRKKTIDMNVTVQDQEDTLGGNWNDKFVTALNGTNAPTLATVRAYDANLNLLNTWTIPDVNNRFIYAITGSTIKNVIYFAIGLTPFSILQLDMTTGAVTDFYTGNPPGTQGAVFDMFSIAGGGLIAKYNAVGSPSPGSRLIYFDEPVGRSAIVLEDIFFDRNTVGYINHLLRTWYDEFNQAARESATAWLEEPYTPPPEIADGGDWMGWRKVYLPDGTVLTSSYSSVYSGGGYSGADTADPENRFGHSGCCPAITTQVLVPSLPVEPTYGGIYQVRRGKTQDTVYTKLDPKETLDLKIPDPFIKTSLLGS